MIEGAERHPLFEEFLRDVGFTWEEYSILENFSKKGIRDGFRFWLRYSAKVDKDRTITLPRGLCRDLGLNPGERYSFRSIEPKLKNSFNIQATKVVPGVIDISDGCWDE